MATNISTMGQQEAFCGSWRMEGGGGEAADVLHKLYYGGRKGH